MAFGSIRKAKASTWRPATVSGSRPRSLSLTASRSRESTSTSFRWVYPAPRAPPAATTAPRPGGCWHVVREGESLRGIARRYYGSARYWRTVQVANDVGLNPEAGRRLWVPGRMPELP